MTITSAHRVGLISALNELLGYYIISKTIINIQKEENVEYLIPRNCIWDFDKRTKKSKYIFAIDAFKRQLITIKKIGNASFLITTMNVCRSKTIIYSWAFPSH